MIQLTFLDFTDFNVSIRTDVKLWYVKIRVVGL